jgi:signal transduction histidine kinase
LLPLHDVRLGVALVRSNSPRASELIKKIDATLRAMERVVDELVGLSRAPSGGVPDRAGTDLAEICRLVIADASIRNPDRDSVRGARNQASGNWDGERVGQVARTVQKIVEAHRGSVEVDSDEARTVFRVTLPKHS